MKIITEDFLQDLIKSDSLISTYEMNSRKAHRITTSEYNLHVVRINYLIFFTRYEGSLYNYKEGDSFGIGSDISNPEEVFHLLEDFK